MKDTTTIGEAFATAVATWGDRQFFAVPAGDGRGYLEAGFEISYAAAAEQVEALTTIYRSAGYGLGHRIATLLENRPEYVLHKLALNSLGVCCVPINPEYRAGEIAYLLDHSEPEIVITLATRRAQVLAGVAESAHRPTIVDLETFATTLPRPSSPALPGQDRIYNPLPLYHANAGVFSLMAAIVTGNCQIQPDRFRPQRWWREIAETRATVVHYLGIIVPLLLEQAASNDERSHQVRFAVGAGVEPELHSAAEKRCIARTGSDLVTLRQDTALRPACIEPRHVGTRAFGRAIEGVEARVVDDDGNDVADPAPGELIIRHSAATPRRGFFTGYLKDEAATELAWRGGWFHTGDVVWRGPDGMLHFVDRKKNIIRRSGENIAAAEVEALLLTHPEVHQVAVMPVKDELREEEVLACVVLREAKPDKAMADALVQYCLDRIAYYKAPGWIHFVPDIPTTGTQKIQKHTIYPKGTDPRSVGGVLDTRSLKRRQ